MYRIVPLSLSLTWMCAQEHITFILYESYGAFLAPSTLHLSLLTSYKYNMCMCNVAHRSLALVARVSACGRKSSRQRGPFTHTGIINFINCLKDYTLFAHDWYFQNGTEVFIL